MNQPPHPCCIPSKQTAGLLEFPRETSAGRVRAARASTADMIRLDGGSFWMGSETPLGFAGDGEGPVRKVSLDRFYIDRFPVTNERFAEFAKASGYVTDAERFGWSFVFAGHIPAERHDTLVQDTAAAAPWWCKVRAANWRHPEGPDTHVENRPHHPVVHVSWNDAACYARWAGRTNDPLLSGPVKAPRGAVVNDPDGVSPQEPVRSAW